MGADAGKIADNLRRFAIAIASHDRENPTHTAFGIGLSPFDMERLGFEEGEHVVPGITIQADGGETGNFRVLCDGDHLAELEAEEAEVVEAVSTQPATVPVGAPSDDERQGANPDTLRAGRMQPRGSTTPGGANR